MTIWEPGPSHQFKFLQTNISITRKKVSVFAQKLEPKAFT